MFVWSFSASPEQQQENKESRIKAVSVSEREKAHAVNNNEMLNNAAMIEVWEMEKSFSLSFFFSFSRDG